jgi:hypothetical protein
MSHNPKQAKLITQPDDQNKHVTHNLSLLHQLHNQALLITLFGQLRASCCCQYDIFDTYACSFTLACSLCLLALFNSFASP